MNKNIYGRFKCPFNDGKKNYMSEKQKPNMVWKRLKHAANTHRLSKHADKRDANINDWIVYTDVDDNIQDLEVLEKDILGRRLKCDVEKPNGRLTKYTFYALHEKHKHFMLYEGVNCKDECMKEENRDLTLTDADEVKIRELVEEHVHMEVKKKIVAFEVDMNEAFAALETELFNKFIEHMGRHIDTYIRDNDLIKKSIKAAVKNQMKTLPQTIETVYKEPEFTNINAFILDIQNELKGYKKRVEKLEKRIEESVKPYTTTEAINAEYIERKIKDYLENKELEALANPDVNKENEELQAKINKRSADADDTNENKKAKTIENEEPEFEVSDNDK